MNVGDKFKYTVGDYEYMLSQVGPKTVCLICIEEKSDFTGNRYSYPVEVVDPHNITPDEWKEITDGGQELFELL